MEGYSLDVTRLVNDIKGFVANLKTIYFESKEPIDDNELILQKLCVKLETAFRHGMKDKYSFLGVRKDYWNFFSECLPKDEGVRYVNSISQLNTVQGKGRALIRYCLVQKTLADTIQRTLMHKRKIEWFSPSALLLNPTLSSELISKLYDLNELEFHLSCTGCDLDMSWPSFGRTLTDGFERRTRRNSGGSIASTTDFANERIDPLVALNAELFALKHMITREFERGETSDDGIGESSHSSNDEVHLNISDVTLELSRLHQLIVKWKSSMDSKIYKAEIEIHRLEEEKDRASRDFNVQLLQLTQKHDNLSELASRESALEVADLQNKLKTAEGIMTNYKTELDSLNCKLSEVSLNHEMCQDNLTGMEHELSDSRKNQEQLEKELCELKEMLQTERRMQRSAKETNNDLKLKLGESEASVMSLKNELKESEAKLRIKTLEQVKLQEAFENVNGLVFSSFEDFDAYYKSQLHDKEKGLEVKDSENKTLERRLNMLSDENSQLKEKLQECQDEVTSSQNELELRLENHRKHEEEFVAVKLQVETFVETFERTNKVLSEYRKSCEESDGDVENVTLISAESSIDEQCQTIINDLNETRKQLKVYEEILEKVVHEKTAVESGSETLSLEVEKLVKQTEELKNENVKLCLDKEEDKRYRTDVENRMRLMEDEKVRLEEGISCALEEKASLESELKVLNEKLEEESYSRLVNENEVSEINEELKKEKDGKVNILEELDEIKREMKEKSEELDGKKTELENCKVELSTLETSFGKANNDLETMREKMNLLLNEKNECAEEVVIYQEKLASLQCTMDQEVSSLKFQLSSEALRYDDEIKQISKENEEATALKEKIQEYEETITELENKLRERNEAWQTERKKLTGDVKLLKHEINVLNDNINADKEEIKSIEGTLMLSKKQCEKEKGRNNEYRRTIREIKEQKSEKEKLLEQEKAELEEDIRQLKMKMVSLLSDKSELWKRSNQLEFDMKTRLSETWVDDRDVTHCPECNVEFSLFVRKHHCRFCGEVFCRLCSDNFIKTIHSRKPYRSCKACYEKEKELRSDISLTPNTSQLEHGQSNLSVSSYSSDSETNSSVGEISGGSLNVTPSPSKKMMKNQGETKAPENAVHVRSGQAGYCASDDLDDTYEVIEESDDSLHSMLNDGLNVRAEVRTPDDHEHPQPWSEATIPAGKRYLLSTNVVAGSHVVIEFATSQSISFGIAMKANKLTDKTKTVIPLCQMNSHQRNVKNIVQMSSSGVAIFIFDNTRSKSTVNKLRFKTYLHSSGGVE